MHDAVAATLRAERARLDVTMDELARRSGLSKSTIVRMEKGARSPDVEQLSALVGVYGITISQLFAEAERRAGT